MYEGTCGQTLVTVTALGTVAALIIVTTLVTANRLITITRFQIPFFFSRSAQLYIGYAICG